MLLKSFKSIFEETYENVIQILYYMEKQKKCMCRFCQNGDYSSDDFVVDMSFLKKERHTGVTGLLRVRNDADFLSDCIDSCIDALDELIVCYQDCTDNAPEIIYKKQQQYPDKIKVYYYAPPVFGRDSLTKQEKEHAFSLPDTSVHKLCNYYNYTLSKATYRYAMKIDSDQVYFPEKLKRICNAYRTEKSVKISLENYLAKYFVKVYRIALRCCPILIKINLLSLIPGVPRFVMKKYEDYLVKEIIQNKYALSLSGINLGYVQGRWGILSKYPFNGVGDTLIFRISENTFYRTLPGNTSLMEFMNYSGVILVNGWFWYHLKSMRTSESLNPKEWIALTSKLKLSEIGTDWPSFKPYQWIIFWKYDKDLPDPDKILAETTKNIINRKRICDNKFISCNKHEK